MSPQSFLAKLERSGVVVKVTGDRLRVEAPRGVLTEALRARLAECKPELIVAMAGGEGWPEVSRDCVRRFRRPEARLYPYLGRQVITPAGRGRLLEVFPDRASVRVSGRVVVFLSSEVRPPGVETPYEEPFEAVN